MEIVRSPRYVSYFVCKVNVDIAHRLWETLIADSSIFGRQWFVCCFHSSFRTHVLFASWCPKIFCKQDDLMSDRVLAHAAYKTLSFWFNSPVMLTKLFHMGALFSHSKGCFFGAQFYQCELALLSPKLLGLHVVTCWKSSYQTN